MSKFSRIHCENKRTLFLQRKNNIRNAHNKNEGLKDFANWKHGRDAIKGENDIDCHYIRVDHVQRVAFKTIEISLHVIRCVCKIICLGYQSIAAD